MAKKLSNDEFAERVRILSNDKYHVQSDYKGKRKKVKILCEKHNVEFECLAECFMRGTDDVRAACPICNDEEKYSSVRQKIICAYCGKEFVRSNSKCENSKTGLMFCCREHKDQAQRIAFGLRQIWPDHYNTGNGISSYRLKAFNHYMHECAICGWNEDERILEVHHKDSDRAHNDLDNLIILCPTCHRKITLGFYRLTEQNILVKEQE